MQRWQRMNVYFSLIGLAIFLVCIIFVKKVPLLLLPAAFGLGIAYNCFKTIYKQTPPPGYEGEVVDKNNHKKSKKNKKK